MTPHGVKPPLRAIVGAGVWQGARDLVVPGGGHYLDFFGGMQVAGLLRVSAVRLLGFPGLAGTGGRMDFRERAAALRAALGYKLARSALRAPSVNFAPSACF